MSTQTTNVDEHSAVSLDMDASVPKDLAKLRILLVHDWIVAWGGAERTVEQMLTVLPQATLVVGVLGDGKRNFNDVTRRAAETWLARLPGARTHHRWLLPLYPAAFASIDTRGYDLIISSSSAFSKAVRPRRGTPHLCYCYTPPRYLWDLRAEYGRDGSNAGRALSIAGPALRAVDRMSARSVTKFVAISHHIADRIARAYHRESSVVYPPVARKPCTTRVAARGNALLSLSRLVPYKRVDLAVLAANRLGAELIVAGDGPEREYLQSIAGPTVTFIGEVTEEVAGNLLESSRAMIFCADEDFGIAPVEANAHGLPVIAYNRGATRESLVDGRTAVFFDEATPESLCAAIQHAEGVSWDEEVIRANAARFSRERFRGAFADEVRSIV